MTRRIVASKPTALAGLVQQHALNRPSQIALSFDAQHEVGHGDITYLQLWQQVQQATHFLAMRGLQTGDRVAYLGLNHPDQLVLLFALACLKAILLPLNYRLAQAELAHVLKDAEPTLILFDDLHAATAASLASVQVMQTVALADLKTHGLSHVGLSIATADTFESREPIEPIDADPDLQDAPVLLVYTSGTSGKPKGALHTQAQLLANCQIAVAAMELTDFDHVLTVLPLFHAGGLCIQTLPALYAGARVRLHARFDAGRWLQDVQRLRPTTSLMVPATMRAVLDHPAFASTDLSSLRFLGAGSSIVPTGLIDAFHARSVPVCQIYGATETGPASIILPCADAVQRAGSAGKPGLGVRVRLVSDTGTDVAPGAVGEIAICAPNVMRGYWRDPHNASFQDGWFRTGDLARCDADGFYWMVGRSKDMIISGGENIYPAELENILADCPQILEAAVVGQRDPKWGEVAVAVVVCQAGVSLSTTQVLQLFDGQLARFKHPRRVVFVAALPKTALGKVQKAQLLATIEPP